MRVINMEIHLLSAERLQMHDIPNVQVENPIIFFLSHQYCFNVVAQFQIVFLVWTKVSEGSFLAICAHGGERTIWILVIFVVNFV